MSYTIRNLIVDVLPRIAKQETPNNGITLLNAANSVQSLIYKRLLYRKSDLLVKAFDPLLPIAAGGYYVALPTDFVSLAERPQACEYTVNYLTDSLGNFLTDSLGNFLTTDPTITSHHHLEPAYLDEDKDHDEYSFWEWYGIYGGAWEPPSIRPQKYKVLGYSLFVRPVVTVDNLIRGYYNFKITTFTAETDVIPWNNFFDEVFRGGVVWMIQKGIEMPDQDAVFMSFVDREVDTVVDSRIHLKPNVRRLKRSVWF